MTKPEFIQYGKTAMRWCDFYNGYYRHAGAWGIRSDLIMVYGDVMFHQHTGIPLLPITEDEWKADHDPY